jgi:drug/metabolite transporter (DMT)-like permease
MAQVMQGSSAGVALAVSTSVLWAISPMFIASVGRRIGSFPTNLWRATIAGVVLATLVLPGRWLMVGTAGLGGIGWAAAGWIVASGVLGMVVGDAFFYEALVLLGPRRAVKMNTLAPVVALGAGWAFQGEALTGWALLGAGLVIGAVVYATFANVDSAAGRENREPGRMTPAGVACGVGSAVCIAFGSVLMREAYKAAPGGKLDSILATTIRVGVAAVVLWCWPVVRGRAGEMVGLVADSSVRKRLALGTFFGALTGMISYVSALKYAPAGLVSTIVATSPLVVIPLVAVRYHVRVGWGIVLAGVVAVVGGGMISWK